MPGSLSESRQPESIRLSLDSPGMLPRPIDSFPGQPCLRGGKGEGARGSAPRVRFANRLDSSILDNRHEREVRRIDAGKLRSRWTIHARLLARNPSPFPLPQGEGNVFSALLPRVGES